MTPETVRDCLAVCPALFDRPLGRSQCSFAYTTHMPPVAPLCIAHFATVALLHSLCYGRLLHLQVHQRTLLTTSWDSENS